MVKHPAAHFALLMLGTGIACIVWYSVAGVAWVVSKIRIVK